MTEVQGMVELVSDAQLDGGLREFARLRNRIDRFAGGEEVGDLADAGRRLVSLVLPLKAALVGSDLPLGRERFEEVRAAVDGAAAAARQNLRVLQEMRSPYLYGFRGAAEVLGSGLSMLAEAFEVCCLAGLSVPQSFWLSAHALYLRARSEVCAEAVVAYKRLLALATIQPESFTSDELVDVFALVRASADLGELLNGVGEPPGQGWFWVDIAQDSPPVAIVRREPPPVDDLIYFSAAALARAASERLAERTSLGAAAPADPQDETVDGAREAMLRRLRERWAMPPRRAQPRRRSEYAVEVCAGLEEIWLRLVRGDALSPPVNEWAVQNESPGGFSIIRVAGDGGGLSAGMAIALRRQPAVGWAVCVVRWIRSEQPDQVELGLQLVSQAAIPVKVAFRSGASARSPVAALVLPPLAGVRRHQAVLAPAGTYAARRFMLVHDSDRLYVAQGRLLSLDMQTEAVELFQFEVDPYPI